jgi:hypothetical protein
VSRGQIIQAYRRQDRTAVFGTTIGWEGDYIHDRESRNRTGWEIVADLLRLMLPKGAAS